MKRKMTIIFLSTSISLLFSSCSTVLDIITGNSRCIYPNCTERATDDSAYCSYHTENPVYAFRTIRAIFAEGLNLFLRPRRRSDRPAAFAIHSNGKTE